MLHKMLSACYKCT